MYYNVIRTGIFYKELFSVCLLDKSGSIDYVTLII